MSVFNLRLRVCSSINLSVLLEKTPFNITHSRSQIEWSGLLIYIYIYILIINKLINHLRQKLIYMCLLFRVLDMKL